ncbi:hypothetical protein U9M48_008148 [Paspalum notatum var. saurae]|uniref:Uncharacterized protein n=1 Tax=Paspalum notatum var. saurae TaxID=547442 RepID=A0AAQ3WD53_PASNO
MLLAYYGEVLVAIDTTFWCICASTYMSFAAKTSRLLGPLIPFALLAYDSGYLNTFATILHMSFAARTTGVGGHAAVKQSHVDNITHLNSSNDFSTGLSLDLSEYAAAISPISGFHFALENRDWHSV